MSKNPAANTKKIHQPIREGHLPFTRQNYILMLIGFGIIILGFLLLIGKEDIYDFRKIVLAPTVIVFGFVFELYAIMKQPKRETTGTDAPTV
jgi:hypothetical protein